MKKTLDRKTGSADYKTENDPEKLSQSDIRENKFSNQFRKRLQKTAHLKIFYF